MNNILEAVSKHPFGPISVLGPIFKSSEYLSMPAGYDPQKKMIRRDVPLRGETRTRLASAELVKGTLNQNLYFLCYYSLIAGSSKTLIRE
jgi:hypothetical protein